MSPPPSEPSAGPDPELLDRLSKLGVSVGTGDIAPPTRDEAGGDSAQPDDDPQQANDLKRAPDGSRSPAVAPLEEAVPGRTLTGEHGRCYLSTVHRARDEAHGGEPLERALAACTRSLAALAKDEALAALDFEGTAFLDTETTGLSGGTGTYAFLIGVGRFVDGGFQVRQFFMRDPSEERAQLEQVAAWTAGCRGLVTFNGRSFDMPLLETRCTVHGRPPLLDAVPHLDLLHPARRLWRRRLPSCALTSLEEHVLGLERQDDVPGWMIPYRYFRYQRDGDARPLVGIFRHNALDILSMVSLVARMARAYRRPEAAELHGLDWLSLARTYAADGDRARAVSACEAALARGLPPDEADRALETLSMAAKRDGDWARAVAVWTDLARAESPRRLYPFEELAKYYEHRLDEPDFAAALQWARRARQQVADGRLRPRRGRRQALADLDHRIARLKRRSEASTKA